MLSSFHFCSMSLAQVGASSSPLFIKPGSAHEGVAHGRYQIKETPARNKVRKPAQEESSVGTPVAQDKVVEHRELPQGSGMVSAAEPDERPPEPSLGEQAQSLFSADATKIQNFYKEQIHPDDIRNNRMEIQFSPALVYNGSQANYSYRSFSSFFSAMDLAANVWMTPAIGLSGRFLFSFGASISGDSATSSTVPAKYEDLDVSLKFRRFFGLVRTAQSLEFDFIYNDFKMSTPSDNLYRPRLNSTGFGLKLISRIPSSIHHAWVFGGSFFPKLQHAEDRTGINIRSGGPVENTRLGLNFGSEFKFSRESQLVYDLAFSTERNSFDGAASPNDPEKGSAPSNVGVTNSFVMFSFGYRWGR